MEDGKNKSKQRFRFFMICILILFAFVYLSGMTGYYESHLAKNTRLTKEAILEFEKDIEEGKAVDIKDYIKADITDYRNVYSKTGYNISNGINTVLNEGVTIFTDFLKTLFS